MRDNANPHRTGKTFFAAKSEGGIPVEEKICPGWCPAFVRIDPNHGHLADHLEES